MNNNSLIRTYPAFAPGSTQAGKFLQFLCEGIPCLLFTTPATHRFHNQLLARFLDDENIEHHWIDEERLKIPEERVRVKGGGRYHLDLAKCTLELWDNSQAYGRFDEEEITRQLANASAPWCDLRLTIR